MSLADAVLEIAEEMERTIEKGGCRLTPPDSYDEVRSWAKQLRRAVKATESPTSSSDRTLTIQSVGGIPVERLHPDPLVAHRQLIEQAREQIRIERKDSADRLERAADLEDSQGQASVKCIGGSLDQTLIILGGRPPYGAFLPQGDEVYQYGEDGLLHYHPGQTERYRKQLPKEEPRRIVTS